MRPCAPKGTDLWQSTASISPTEHTERNSPKEAAPSSPEESTLRGARAATSVDGQLEHPKSHCREVRSTHGLVWWCDTSKMVTTFLPGWITEQKLSGDLGQTGRFQTARCSGQRAFLVCCVVGPDGAIGRWAENCSRS